MNANAIVMEGFIDCIVKQANYFKRIFPYLIPRTKREALMLGSGLAIGVPTGIALVKDKDDSRFTDKSRVAGQSLHRGVREFVQGTLKGEEVTKNSYEVLKGKIIGLTKEGKNDTAFDSIVRGATIGSALGMAANIVGRLPKSLHKRILAARLIQGALLGGIAGAGGGIFEYGRSSKKREPVRYDYHYYRYPEVKEQRIS